MSFYRENGAAFAPCIISQVKFQLHIKATIPQNHKVCSNDYWNDALRTVAKFYHIDEINYLHLLR
jgi:hypothetical protein